MTPEGERLDERPVRSDNRDTHPYRRGPRGSHDSGGLLNSGGKAEIESSERNISLWRNGVRKI